MFITVNEVERNTAGRRIVKVSETGKTPGGEVRTTVSYVVHQPSRLVMVPVRVAGRFTKDKRPEFMACNPPTDDDAGNLASATGWMFVARFTTLAEARLSLGINTSPKRASAVAKAIAAAERLAA